jgi:ribosomal protein S12 methylthiotransferase
MHRNRPASAAKATGVALVSLGCAKNLVDSEVMLGYLKRSGFVPVGRTDKADVIVVNTCGFIQPAREEADEHIRGAIEIKRRRPGTKIAVVGCYVEREGAALGSLFPEVDVWLGVGSFDRIAEAVLGRPVPPPDGTFLYTDASPRVVSTPGTWAYVKISEGCSRRCSFCAIPSIKGPYVSRSTASIVREAEQLVGLGVKEINLVSHDTTGYGRDKGRKDGLLRLLSKLARVPGIEWLRLLYGYPEEVTDSLLSFMAGEDKVCAYLDIPFQHSDPKLIKAMKRGLDGDRALRLLDRIRRRVPGVAVRTSLIVGFPGEGRSEFEALKRFVRKAAFDHLGVFSYSPERGTASYAMGAGAEPAEKERRREEIMTVQAEISRRKNEFRIGEIHQVLLEGRESGATGAWLGRTRFEAPEVDGRVYVRGLSRARGPMEPLVSVELTGAGVYDLQGRVVE